MKKTIISLLVLLVVFVSAIGVYTVYQQPPTEDNSSKGSSGSVSEDDIIHELDDTFLDEDEELEIGDMI